MKKVVAIVLSLMVLCFGSVYAGDFTDLPPEHWAYNDVMALVEEGVINGYEDGTYKPDKKITKAEFLKLISVSCIGNEYFDNIKPLFSHWAGPYASWLIQKNIVRDENSTINIDGPILRIDMAVILSKASDYVKMYEFNDNYNYKNGQISFKDINEISEKDKKHINNITSLGLINGYNIENGIEFRPNNEMTRAEVAAVINRFMSKGRR